MNVISLFYTEYGNYKLNLVRNNDFKTRFFYVNYVIILDEKNE